MNVEKLVPVAYSPIDACRGRGTHKKKQSRNKSSNNRPVSSHSLCENYIIMDISPQYRDK